MTRHKDFKALVRARMAATGENYTTARSMLADRTGPAAREQQLIVSRWFTAGRLRSIPARRKVRAAVLLEVLTRFEPGVSYPESVVSRRLAELHPDFAYLRRELVAFGYLDRDAGRYQVCRTPPARTDQQRRELPAWEALWLPGFITRRRELTS